jgi:hypothetical protein
LQQSWGREGADETTDYTTLFLFYKKKTCAKKENKKEVKKERTGK